MSADSLTRGRMRLIAGELDEEVSTAQLEAAVQNNNPRWMRWSSYTTTPAGVSALGLAYPHG